MVKYCCVYGCGRNTKTKNLSFHQLPKENHRKEEWLKLCGRGDILSRGGNISQRSYVVCSRHFTPKDYSCKLTNLKQNCKPTLHLPPPNVKAVLAYSDEEEDSSHEDILCNSCEKPISGFRYKCVSCKDYDLCRACEFKDEHSEHFMLRMRENLDAVSLEKLMDKWREVITKDHMTVADNASDSSDDDVPITRYKSYDSGVDLAEDVKDTIRKEVNRVLNLKPEELKKKSKKLQSANKKREEIRRTTEIENTEIIDTEATPPNKRLKIETDKEQNSNNLISNVASTTTTQVVFADVNNIDLKSERMDYLNMVQSTSSSQGTTNMPIPVPQIALLQPVPDANQLPAVMVSSLPYPEVPVLPTAVDHRPVMHVKLSDDLTELMVEVTSNNQKTFYKI